MVLRFLKTCATVLCLSVLIGTTARADVAFLVILKVPQANEDAFDALAEKMLDASKADEGLLIYEFARTGETVYGYERYTDDAAHERHQVLIKRFLPELIELAEFERIVTLTDISERSRPGFEAMGAEIGALIGGVAQGSLGD
ncbi:quinol monooxygenase YgiN [Labrenzia sp. EL_208]|nr:quinol monooxygenase YgiN [Labrenzia sp. EL_132]MBG6228294.1 quinol monooxygenase YgiN [Labrenzia sp. EL_208]